MAPFPDLAPVASLIGEPTRAAMLADLLDGRALTAGELASRAGVTASTASSHLSRLIGAGLLVVVSQGRYRYYRLANAEVASALEALAALSPPPVACGEFDRDVLDGLRYARTCYGHLAGRLSVDIRDRLLRMELICCEGSEHLVTPAGEQWFTRLGVDVEAARRVKRSFARACLDWTERRTHLAGALGDALLDALVGRDWLRRQYGERAVEVTDAGRQGLAEVLGLVQGDPASSGAGADGRR